MMAKSGRKDTDGKKEPGIKRAAAQRGGKIEGGKIDGAKPDTVRKRTRTAAKPHGRQDRHNVILEGLGVAGGIGIGQVHLMETGDVHVPEYEIPVEKIEAELERFVAAREKAERQIKKLKTKSLDLHGSAAEEMGFLLDAHLQMLSSSRVTRGVEQRIRHHQNAEAAVQAEISKVAQDFAGLGDDYLAARATDVREVGARLLRNLTKTPYQAFKHLPAGSIVVAEELTPSDTALLDPKQIFGFATVLGGAESHTAIMARSLGIPAVLGIPDLLGRTKTGDIVIVDGTAGRVIINPGEALLADYRRRQGELERDVKQLARLRKLPAVTRDGRRVGLLANLELPREVAMAAQAGAEGIGLVRTEFLFMNREDLPSEDEQYRALREIIEGMEGRPVTIRTLDLGGDKLAVSLGDRLGESANPALGLRAIRLSLRERHLLDTQLAAILRAATHGTVRILLPMISSVGEVKQVREALVQVARRLKRRGAKVPDPLPSVGVMIEVPGAALAADALAQVSDFFAIGSNDLTMYTLAIDRGEEQVAHLYNPLHPAVLRLIQFATEAALRSGIQISICGEIAGDPRYTPLLLGLGIQDLSMASTSLPRVKQRIRNIDFVAATRCARLIMDQSDMGRIAMLLDDFNALAM
ncbi:phosphoenolpyruvate--protein phosphotransferase [Dongia soli]|uniref:Phosphoenolpyruvate-protein phosphotransferase n=1 Tax=Dongia soli TaxID=600628 RepID=A0ABU5E839_9PROT|nr:phosphoenolpyruvate--protein phosphotransferase [Dongia soli]MDY0882356.1 phosphoenolpyruvate--protein phosphotransferase [Dongia soli]